MPDAAWLSTVRGRGRVMGGRKIQKVTRMESGGQTQRSENERPKDRERRNENGSYTEVKHCGEEGEVTLRILDYFAFFQTFVRSEIVPQP